MSPAASFAERWARDNLTREPTTDELTVLELFPITCDGDEGEASKRARRYYKARGPGGMTELWHKRYPDDEDILSSCQDATNAGGWDRLLQHYQAERTSAYGTQSAIYVCGGSARAPLWVRTLAWPVTGFTSNSLPPIITYIVPLRARSVGGRRMTIVRLPAPTALDRPLSAKALLARWLMILDIRLREDPTPGEEIVFIDVSDLQPSHLRNHFKGTYWKDFVGCMRNAYPHRFTEVHVINTQRLKTMSLLLLHIGLYPWRRNVVRIHANAEQINQAIGIDYFPLEGLPYEYGGRAGAMKDLNDEWTKKLLLNSKWLQAEEHKFYNTELLPEIKSRRQRNTMKNLRGNIGSYDMINRTHSCKSIHIRDDLDEALYGAYRTLKLKTDKR